MQEAALRWWWFTEEEEELFLLQKRRRVRLEPALIVPGSAPAASGFFPVGGKVADVTIAHSVIALSVVTASSLGTSVVTLDAAAGEDYSLAVSVSLTVNAVNLVAGRPCFLTITAVGGTSRTVTFGGNFASAGTLATGTTAGKRFPFVFRESAGVLVEYSRAGPL